PMMLVLTSPPARDGDALANGGCRPALLPWIGMGRSPFRTAGNDEQASSVAAPAYGRPVDDQKSPVRRCFKPRPPWRAGCAGFASGCRSSGFGAQAIAATLAISLRAAVRPLVRMPTDRHTATGTCEIGQLRT